MRKNDSKLQILEFKNAFSGIRSVQKADLRVFYHKHSQVMTEQAFRRFLYALEKQEIITPIGAGVYALNDMSSPQALKKRQFAPTLSQELVELYKVIQGAFPYIHYLGWETKVLHEFMVQQPGQNLFIIETEKDVCESVFNHLTQKYPGRTFLDPDQVTIERYVLQQPESILISRLITQSPKKKIRGIPFPKLEKVLVDIFADADKFYVFQGDELVHIFENAFTSYWISNKTLYRYAGRRKVGTKLQEFISMQTQIDLSQIQENIK